MNPFSSLLSKAGNAKLRLLPTIPAMLLAAAVIQINPTPVVAQAMGGVVASLRVQDDTGADTTLNLATWMTFDEAAGKLALVAPGTNLGDSGWRWTRTVPTPGAEEDAITLPATTPKFLSWSNETLTTISLFDLSGKIDPTMNYSFAVKNNTASTQTYTFVFGEAIVPTITGAYTVEADVGYSLSTKSPIATIAPVGAATHFQLLQFSADGGASSFNAGVNVGTTFSRGTNGTSATTDASGLLNGTTALTLNYWEFQTTFTLTPGDSIGITGFAELTPVPEPSTYALLLGCAVFGIIAAQRMNPRRARSMAAPFTS